MLVRTKWTDNRGNGAALNKLMTTRFPASAVLMELASHMKAMALKVQLEWTPWTARFLVFCLPCITCYSVGVSVVADTRIEEG